MFIIATNELDEKKISDAQLLDVYKAQGVSVERGFRFLKDPMFYAESLYLNSPRRIMSPIMVMGLSLLVYALAERKIRKAMKERGASISNQVNKPTQTPTIQWVFQVFEGILILTVQENERITRMAMRTNLERERFAAQELYEEVYCARGDMENRIKEQQLYLFSDRTSSATMQANQLRLYFSSLAYVLLSELRRQALRGTQFAKAQCNTIRLKLLKIGAHVRISVRRIYLSFASGYPYQETFYQILGNLKKAYP